MSVRRVVDGTRGRARRALVVALGMCVAACGDDGSTPATIDDPSISPTALAYLNRALDLMQEHSIKRHEIEWTSFRDAAVSRAGVAQVPSDTYDAIRFAVTALGDYHSRFIEPPFVGSSPVPGRSPAPASGPPSARRLEGGLGYIHVGSWGGAKTAADALATAYQRAIEAIDTLGLCAWVVDLRGNFGGNMWPMVAGVGPIVGEGVLGYFVDPDSVVETWSYGAGGAALDGYVLAQADAPYTLHMDDPPVAVLTDHLTASAGEATVIALRGRPDTRSFGSATFGVSTGNAGYYLSDGAILVLTQTTMADRTGRLYGREVVPDTLVWGDLTADPATDRPLGSAVAWLLQQPACTEAGWNFSLD